MNLQPRIKRLRREAELLSHPDVQAIAQTLDQEPTILLGNQPKIRFSLPSWLWQHQVELTYEEILENPQTFAGSDGLYLNLEEPIGEAFDAQIVLSVQASADYPDSVKEMLMDLGKLRLQVQEPYTYHSLQCD